MKLRTRAACDLLIRSVIGSALIALGATDAAALPSFGRPLAIGSHAALDDPAPLASLEGSPATVGDGAGNWVTVWSGTAGPPLADPTNNEVWVARSSDDGVTWSNPTALVATTGADFTPWIATDRQGVWIVTWVASGENAPLVSRSLDNGATWSAPIAPFGFGTSRSPRVATDEAGTWVLIVDGAASILATRSTDDGQTWSPYVVIDSPGSTFSAALATDRSGVWVAIWQRFNLGGTAAVARSTDNGVSWETPIELGELGPYGTSLSSGSVEIATDLQSRWVAIWEATPTFTEGILRYSTSSDDGATWTPQATFPPIAGSGTYDRTVSTETSSDGTIHAAWISDLKSGASAEDYDLFMARSLDGGVSWSSAMAINLLNRSDGGVGDFEIHLGYDREDRWIATWASANTLGDTIGEDYDILFARAGDDCPATPAAGCKTPTDAGASRLRIKDDPDGPMDRLTWSWPRGQQTLPADLGDPTTNANYVLCVYDDSGSGYRPVFEADAGAALLCDGVACWTGTSEQYSYRDRKRENGAIASILLRSGEEGRAKVRVKASGGALGAPHLPLAKSPSAKAQLINLQTNACWEATYSSAKSNTSTQFKAESD